MSATGRQQEVVICTLNIVLAIHFTDGSGEKEGFFFPMIQRGRKELGDI